MTVYSSAVLQKLQCRHFYLISLISWKKDMSKKKTFKSIQREQTKKERFEWSSFTQKAMAFISISMNILAAAAAARL